MMENDGSPPTEKRGQRHGMVVALLVLAMMVLYLMVGRVGAKPEGWLTDLDQAKRQAEASKKLVFVEFGAGWCPPCRQMKRDVFPNPQVQEALAGFVSVHIDVDTQPEVATRHGVEMLPTLMVLDHQGTVRAHWVGGMSAAELILFLNRVRRPQ